MIRAFVSGVAVVISMLGHVGPGASSAVAQGATRNDCAASDPACSSMIPGFAAMGSRVLAPKGDQDGAPAQRLAMVVSPLTLAEPATRAQLRVHLGPTDGLPQNSFVRIRGLPPAITVPNGHSIASGTWAVPLFALPEVAISLPEGTQGWSEVALALVAPDGKVLAEAKTRLVVASRAEAGGGAAAAAAKPARVTPEDRERALQLHSQGQAQLDIGNVAAARRFFELATGAGLAESVMALAATYDPNELVRLGSLGPRPDVEAARRWYQRARDLGAAGAEARLQRLSTR